MRKQAKRKGTNMSKRTKEEIQQEYANLCAIVGECQVKRRALDYTENKTMGQIADLSKELEAATTTTTTTTPETVTQ